MQITDRAKDLIKSGGEWISSIDVENMAIAHPGIANAAVIAVPHNAKGSTISSQRAEVGIGMGG